MVNRLTDEIRQEAPYSMLADDLVLSSESQDQNAVEVGEEMKCTAKERNGTQ